MEQKHLKTSKDIISPKKMDISLPTVKFSKSWAFWENYSTKEKKLSYLESNKQIFKWDDIITFFQFWNKYPGNDIKNIFFDGQDLKYFFKEKYRINSINIFIEGIKPMWEDEQNKGGKYFQLDYKVNIEKINDFITASNYQWKKLALNLMGMNLPGADYINGIRFIDKTDFDRGKIIMFRIEVWIRKNVDENIIEDIKKYLKENLGCEKINVLDIK
jgi:hypothetical protein